MNQPTDNPVDYENLEDALNEEAAEEEETTETGEEEETEETPAGEEEQEKPAGEEFRFPDNDPRVPEKFRGKTAFEVLESYSNLEGMVTQKAIEIAKGMLPGGHKVDEKKAGEEEIDIQKELGLSEEEMQKMTPKQFMMHMNKLITTRAQKIVQDTLQQTTEMQNTVRKEIREVTKAHPHLKTNKDYRETVLDIIEAGKARGKDLSLAEACKIADTRMGIKPGQAPAGDTTTTTTKPKPRTAVETTDGPGGGKVDTEEDAVKKGILGQSTNGLPGLGI